MTEPSSASSSSTNTTTSSHGVTNTHPQLSREELQRHTYARSIMGKDLFKKVDTAKILVVGAGGIGCELLKNLVLVGFGNIEIIDLDTIDLSNLNRQFLFQKQHIKKPKSIIACQTALGFNPTSNIVAHHANIKEPQFGLDYFSGFDMVLNALDNLEARRWVNKMCLSAKVPLVESGTAGFLGQVQPIMKDVTECYDCIPKVPPKTYPVCTIRSTPSAPIHCIVWAKSWLFTQLFGPEDENEEEELNQALKDGENADEINSLRKEAQEMSVIRSNLTSPGSAKKVFNKVFKADTERLLGMEDMWKSRGKPTPLDHDSAKLEKAEDQAKKQENAAVSGATLKDQRVWTLKDCVDVFDKSLESLAARAAADPSTPLSFDKDDPDALDFVTAASNLRSLVYSIPLKTRFEVKEMAGNIIPAIASTNAIIAGLLVIQSLQVLRGIWSRTRFISLTRQRTAVLSSWEPPKPRPECGTCLDHYILLRVDLARASLGTIIDKVVKSPREQGGLGIEYETVVYEANRLLADPDFDDNHEKSLHDLGIKDGMMITISDEDSVMRNVNLMIQPLNEEEAKDKDLLFVLPQKEELPEWTEKPKKVTYEESDDDDFEVSTTAPAPVSTGKRKREEGEDGTEGASKKRQTENGDEVNGESTKKRKTGDDENSAIVLD